MPVRGHFSRSRSLEDLNKRFGTGIVEKIVGLMLKRNGNVRVLELGCGEGRVLMQLRKLFPSIELHGINKKKWGAMKSSKSLMQTGLFYKIFTRTELRKVKLPKIHFYDANRLRFKSNYFDLIISQVAIPYFERKDWVLEEIWRTLRKGGMAFLYIDGYQKNYPDFLPPDNPRFLIYKNGKLYPLKNLINNTRERGFNIKYFVRKSKDGTIKSRILMIKNTKRALKLNLKFDEVPSFNLIDLDLDRKRTDIFWGYRSVFRL